MEEARRAVVMMEEQLVPGLERPLMLESFLGVPVLTRMAKRLGELGVERLFLACAPEWKREAEGCLPGELEAVLSDKRADLLEFLDTEERVLVLNRSALPVEEAGAGFAYTAEGRELRETWKERLTNAVQGAALVSGWLPLFGMETMRELEPLFQNS